MNATASTETAAPATAPAKNQRTLVGRVVSNKMQKTVVVLVERRVKHAAFGKIITRSSKYHAHVATGEFKQGDLVEIAECRPISKTKAWTVTRLVEKSKLVE
jgi:small subunit ribosomal protein S17